MRRCDGRGVLKKEIATLTGSVGSEVMGPIPNLEIQICGKAGGLAQLPLVLYPEHGRESIPLTYPLLSELLCPHRIYIITMSSSLHSSFSASPPRLLSFDTQSSPPIHNELLPRPQSQPRRVLDPLPSSPRPRRPKAFPSRHR